MALIRTEPVMDPYRRPCPATDGASPQVGEEPFGVGHPDCPTGARVSLPTSAPGSLPRPY